MMQIHRIRGRNLREALERARAVHGESALVLSHEQLPGGDVLVAVKEPPKPARKRARPVPDPLSASPATAEPGLMDVRRRLVRAGASAELCERVVALTAKSGRRGAFALDAAADVLGRLVPTAPAPRSAGGTAVIALVGPTGVGKTTTLAKLASKLVRARRRVALATSDTFRVGAVDQLGQVADLLQVPCHTARSGEELEAALRRSGVCDVLLVDTSGRSPRDARALARLAELLASGTRTATLHPLLVLSATSSREALDEAILAFDPIAPAGCVVTKLDETRAPAAVFECAARAGLGLSFLCDGQDLAANLHRATPGRVADAFLAGRLS